MGRTGQTVWMNLLAVAMATGWLGLCGLPGWMPASECAAEEVVEDDSARVTGTLVVPVELDSFAGRRLELRLYMMPPRLPMPRPSWWAWSG
jgi:hypothetical protein